MKLRFRANRIAKTEAANAANAAVDLAFREAVLTGQLDNSLYELEWIARAINTCPICTSMDGVRRRLLGRVFVSRTIGSGRLAGQQVSFERPTAHPYRYCGIRTVSRDAALAIAG